MNFSNSFAFSVGRAQRTELTSNDQRETPAPWDYEVKEVKPKSPIVLLDTLSKKSIDRIDNNPGPGTYITNPKSKLSKFTIGERRPIEDNRKVPGPGSYKWTNVDKPSIPARSFGYRFTTETGNEDIPGPNHYNIPTGFNSPSAKFTTGSRSTLTLPNQEVPGPGAYSPKDINLANSPKFKTAERKIGLQTEVENNPGPGAYDTLLSQKRMKGFSIKGKRRDLQAEESTAPGPGNYKLPSTLAKRAFSVGRANRRPLNDSDARFPGPGTYESNLNATSIGGKFGAGERFQKGQTEETPGPGSYNQFKDEIARRKSDASKDRLRKILIDPLSKESMPGPGSYNPTFSNVWFASPGFKVGTSKRSQVEQNSLNPGPGNYDFKDTHPTNSYSFGNAIRRKELKKSLFDPGPGSYDLPHTIGLLPSYVFPEGPKKMNL